MTMRTKRHAPYKHADGSGCWTKNCSIGNTKIHTIQIIQEWFNPSSNKAESVQLNVNKNLLQPSDRIRKGLNGLNNEILKNLNKVSEEFDDSLSKDEMQAVVSYMQYGYEYVNSMLRGKKHLQNFIKHENKINKYHHTTEEEYLSRGNKMIPLLDQAFKKFNRHHTEEKVLYRGYRVKPQKGLTNAESVQKHINETYTVGEIIENKGYTSTSVDSDYMLLFAEKAQETNMVIVHEIVSRRGIPIEACGGDGGLTSVEHETLLPRNSKLRVVNIINATFETSYDKNTKNTALRFFFKNSIQKKKFIVIQMVDESIE